jgi:hypothetical protein
MSPRYYDVSVFVQGFLLPVVSRLLCWRGLEVSESTREVLQHMLGGAFFVPLPFFSHRHHDMPQAGACMT